MEDFFNSNRDRLDFVLSFPFEEKRPYMSFLAQTRHYVAHTTRLIGLTASRIGPEREQLHFHFLRSASEERSHHLLAENDLERMGSSFDRFAELPMTSALYQTQYYKVMFQAPTTLFGHILVLEGLAVLHGQAIYDRAAAAHGANACTFIKLHANEDPGHLTGLFKAVEILTPTEIDAAQANFLHTCDLYSRLLGAITEHAKEER